MKPDPDNLPVIVLSPAGRLHAGRRFVEFFTANTRNPNTRKAYYRQTSIFLTGAIGRPGAGMAKDAANCAALLHKSEYARALTLSVKPRVLFQLLKPPSKLTWNTRGHDVAGGG